MTQIWKHDAFARGATDAVISNWDPFLDVPSTLRKPLAHIMPTVTMQIELSNTSPPTDYFRIGTRDFVSQRLRSLLDHFHVPAELFPVDVTQNGLPYSGQAYFYLNPLDVVDCFDRQRAKYRKPNSRGYISTVDALVIDEQKAAGHHLFELENVSIWPAMCVSDELADVIRHEHISGVELLPFAEMLPFTWAKDEDDEQPSSQ